LDAAIAGPFADIVALAQVVFAQVKFTTDHSISQYVRLQAIQALASFDDPKPKTIMALIRALQDDDSQVRQQAEAILGRLGKAQVAEALGQALVNGESWTRASALNKLSFLMIFK
jgi:HEAT repeat protein